ncbi:MAG: MBL fold metallo-hydrolase, partial [Verrucomicrobiota bacterium]
MASFQSLTRQNEIGANSYLLSLGDNRIVLDSGLHPRETGNDALPNFSLLNDTHVDGIVVTHPHLDHVGSLPVLQRRHHHSKVFLTHPTADLTEAMLHNSVSVMTSQREQLEIREYPLFTHKEIDQIQSAWEIRAPDRPFPIGNHGDPVECEFYDAGHVLGSVGTMFRHNDLKVFYTGDVHFEDQTLSRQAAFPEGPVDVVITETTRGDSPRPADYSRSSESTRFAEAINATIQRGGSVLIPVFALGKTQEILTLIHELRSRGEIPANAPVFIGGLSTKMTTIYDAHAQSARRHHPGFKILDDMELLLTLPRQRRRRRDKRPAPPEPSPGCIYALSSGMVTENTVSNAFARNLLPDPRHSILFVGYADPETPGGKILDAQHGDLITLHPDEPPVLLGARVEKFDFSGHAPRDHIVDAIDRLSPKKILLVHGDPSSLEWTAQELRQRRPRGGRRRRPPGRPGGGGGGPPARARRRAPPGGGGGGRAGPP